MKENGYLVTKEQLDEIVKNFDSDSNGTIEYQEFLRGVCDKNSLYSKNNLKSAFDCIDEGMKGYINANDIKNFIFKEMEVTDKILEDYLNQFGMNIEDKLTFNDFTYLIKKNKKLNDFGENDKHKNMVKNYNTINDFHRNLNLNIYNEKIKESKTVK